MSFQQFALVVWFVGIVAISVALVFAVSYLIRGR